MKAAAIEQFPGFALTPFCVNTIVNGGGGETGVDRRNLNAI